MDSFIAKTLVTNFPSLKEPFYDLPSWYWVFLIFSLLIAFFLGSLLKDPLSYLAAYLSSHKYRYEKSLMVEKLRGPIHVFVFLIIFLGLNTLIDEPAKAEGKISIAIKLAFFFSFTYLCYRLIDLSFSRLIRQHHSGRSRVGLILPLGRRVAKTILVIVAVLLLLSQFGVDVSSLLVGLGVGGLAIALAAQKILENLFGGAVLSLDQPFQVGDYCKCGDILGFVEEIGLRSTRIRTLDRTVVSIPNSKLSEIHIENYMEREKIRLYTTMKFDLSTPLAKLQDLLSEFEMILTKNENFHHDIYRLRLIGVSDLGFEVEIYAFAKSIDWHEFVRIREDLLFAFLEKIEAFDIKFAIPTRKNFIYKEPSMPPSS